MSDSDVARYRRECGATDQLAYLNNARISPYPRSTREVYKAAIEREYAQQWARELDAEAITSARTALATLLDANSDEVALMQSASYGANAILEGLAWQPGDNIVWTELEYRSVAHVLFRIRDEHGVELRTVGAQGWRLDPDSVLAAVDERTRLVIVPMVPTFCGVVQPVEEIGKRLAGGPALYAVNATQAVGRLPVSVRQIGCDFLFGTSRKWLRGPRGLGFMFVRRPCISRLRPLNLGYPAATWSELHAMQINPTIERFHVGDYPYPAVLALAESVQYALQVGMDAIAERNRELGRLCRQMLGEIKGLTLHDAGEGTLSTIPCNLHGMDADTVVQELAQKGITVCSLDVTTGRPAFEKMGIRSLVRISPHYYNTSQEIVRLAQAMEELGGRGR